MVAKSKKIEIPDQPDDLEPPYFKMHFPWKGVPSTFNCKTLKHAKTIRMMLKKQGIESFVTEVE